MIKFINIIFIKTVKLYQYVISPLLGNNCRYFPSCSDYSIEALRTYGFFKGLFMTIKRVLSCHPFKEGGIDPVEKEMEEK